MNASPIIVRGTLRSDGTLELDDPPSLPAGPVEVVLRPLSSTGPAGEDWWQYLQRVRGEAEAGGGPYLSQREIDSGREDIVLILRIHRPRSSHPDRDSSY